mmetsp:Transcript_19966/g.63187  ORF Transcript_19966/g.63187 Transcript_19966/m.63187 type:complete len:309 (-) Transcript_19966:455-1381(-)
MRCSPVLVQPRDSDPLQQRVLRELARHLPLQAQLAVGKGRGHVGEAPDAQFLHAHLHALQQVADERLHRAADDSRPSGAHLHERGALGPRLAVAQLYADAVMVVVVPRGLLSPFQCRVKGDGNGTEAQSLQHSAHVAGLTIGEHWDVVVLMHEPGNLIERCCLCRACTANAETVYPRVAEGLGLAARLHRAGQDVKVLVVVLHSLDEVDRVGEDAVLCVHADKVHAGVDERLHAVPSVLVTGADGRSADERPVRVSRRIGVLALSLEVAPADQRHQLPLFVDDRQLCHLGLCHDLSRLLDRHWFPDVG